MSEDNQWRQLGSIVNAVLLDARTKAIRTGSISRPVVRSAPRNTALVAGGSTRGGAGNGFLSDEARPAQPPVQLELPFGIAPHPQEGFAKPRSPRGARLM